MTAQRPVNERFAAALRAARERKGWTQEDLAREANERSGGAHLEYSPWLVNHCEAGLYDPHGSLLIALADALGVTTDELLGRTP